jgi:hypothetical protein
VNGRNMGLLFKLAEEWLTKAQIELKHTLTLAVVKELLTEVEQFLWASHEMDPVFSFSWAAQFVVSSPLSHGVLMLRCSDSNFQNWSFYIPKLVDPAGLVLESGAKARALGLHVIAKLRDYADAEQVFWIHQPATTFLKCPKRVLFQFLCRKHML